MTMAKALSVAKKIIRHRWCADVFPYRGDIIKRALLVNAMDDLPSELALAGEIAQAINGAVQTQDHKVYVSF